MGCSEGSTTGWQDDEQLLGLPYHHCCTLYVDEMVSETVIQRGARKLERQVLVMPTGS
jgi:hypothetical protein